MKGRRQVDKSVIWEDGSRTYADASRRAPDPPGTWRWDLYQGTGSATSTSLAQLFARVKQAQKAIDDAERRIKANENENRLDRAMIAKLEGDMDLFAVQIKEARRVAE